MSVTADLVINMVTAGILLSVFFVSVLTELSGCCLVGVNGLGHRWSRRTSTLAACPQDSHLFITTPKQLNGISGSCLQIPCNFSTKIGEKFNDTGSTFGVWYKKNPRLYQSNVIFNSSQKINKFSLRLTGDLSQNDCTSLFSSVISSYTDTYFFRIESSPFMATAFCDPLHITVEDSPPRPTVEISGDLKEKESVTVTCSALTPCPHSPPQLTWNLQQNSQNIMEENSDRTFTTKIQKTITLSHQHDGYIISCSAKYPVNEGKRIKFAMERKTLNVSYSPRDTSVVISPTDPVSAGSMVNLTCSCRGNPPVFHFIWFMISNGRLELIKVDTQVYGFKVTDSDRGRLFYCGCRNDVDIQLSTGRQLIFEGDLFSKLVGVPVITKILGITMLISILVTFECCFRFRRSTKPMEEPVESEYVNTMTELTS